MSGCSSASWPGSWWRPRSRPSSWERVGGPGVALLSALTDGEDALGAAVRALVPAGVTAVVAGVVLAAVARLAARMLRSHVRAGMDPENLRVA